MVDTAIVRSPALEELKIGKQWVCFNAKKIPYNAGNGSAAASDNPETWQSYELAKKSWIVNSGFYAGIGRMFLRSQGITGVDLDKCIDDQGNIAEWALAIVKLLKSYTEYSPSKRGLHIWVHGVLPQNLAPNKPLPDGIEMYDHLRYFTVTGKHFAGTPTTIEDRQTELLNLFQEVTTKRAAAKKQTEKPAKEQPTAASSSAYGLTALENECRVMRMTGEGARNDQLNRSAFALGQLIGGGELDRTTVEMQLFASAAAAGLDDDREIEKTMRSGIENGMADPRKAPEKPSAVKKGILQRAQEEPAPLPDDLATIAAVKNLCNFSADDAGNGDAFYNLYGEKYLYCSKLGWLVYTGTHWQLDPDGAKVKKDAVCTLRKRRHAAVDQEKESIVSCTKADTKRVNGCIDRFKSLVDIDIEAFDRHPDLLNCLNGVLDLRTGDLAPHDPTQKFTYCVPVAYNPLAVCQEWNEFLESVVGGGQEIIDYLQLAAGYSLTGQTNEEILFYLFGPPRSGKGTWSEVMMCLLPHPLGTMVDFNTFTAKREGDVSNFDLAPLKPCRMIFASESNRGQSLNPAKIKQMTGGDLVRACYKHKDFFTYRPQFKMWMLSNWPVNGDPDDDALWGRVRVIEFPNSFLGKEDKSKKARLKTTEALEGVLAWTVQGAKQWYALGAQGLTTPQTIAETTKKHRSEQDYIQQWLDEYCEVDQENDQAFTTNKDLMASYLEWCKENSIQYPHNPKKLAQTLQIKGFKTGMQKKIDGKNYKGVIGIKSALVTDRVTGNGSNGRITLVPLWTKNQTSSNFPLPPVTVTGNGELQPVQNGKKELVAPCEQLISSGNGIQEKKILPLPTPIEGLIGVGGVGNSPHLSSLLSSANFLEEEKKEAEIQKPDRVCKIPTPPTLISSLSEAEREKARSLPTFGEEDF